MPSTGRPRGVTLGGVAFALFRAPDGSPRAVIDACPHRAHPLSEGRVGPGGLTCAYHGWRFNADGACIDVPGRRAAVTTSPACLTTHRAMDAHGVTWIAVDAADAALRPPEISLTATDDALSFRWTSRFDGALADVAENILDVAHTAFLHRGLFRSPDRGASIEARVTRTAERIEVDYIGEPVPPGILGRVLAPRGGVVTHVDRFVMPCVAQVEYSVGDRLRLIATTFLSPEEPSITRALHVVSMAPRWLALVTLPAFAPLAWHVLRQDIRALRLQSANLARLPNMRFTSTEVDTLGPHARQMLERAERGAAALPDAEWAVGLHL